jgi:hypothetical protein
MSQAPDAGRPVDDGRGSPAAAARHLRAWLIAMPTVGPLMGAVLPGGIGLTLRQRRRPELSRAPESAAGEATIDPSEWYWVDDAITPIRDAEGRSTGWVNLQRNVNALVGQEAAERASRENAETKARIAALLRATRRCRSGWATRATSRSTSRSARRSCARWPARCRGSTTRRRANAASSSRTPATRSGRR